VTSLFRVGNRNTVGKPSMLAFTRIHRGWFGGEGNAAPPAPRDERVLGEAELQLFVASLTRNGFFGPGSYYMNHHPNETYSSEVEGTLKMPTLFIAAKYDSVCTGKGKCPCAGVRLCVRVSMRVCM
jgi:hypothetical protein